jgi:RIO-like serine/threonine protein kinase
MPSDEPDAQGEHAATGGLRTPDDVEARTVAVLGKEGPFRPKVRLLEAGGARLVAKDYRVCWAPYRWTIGAWNLAREEEALRRLSGIDGVPEFRGRVGRWILLMTWFRGRDIGKVRKYRQTPAFYEALAAMVEEMHRRGVVHLDLRQRRNILFRPRERRPAILDFGSALCVRPGGALHRLLVRIDRSGVLKYKDRARPGSLTSEEARSLRRIERRRRWWPFS